MRTKAQLRYGQWPASRVPGSRGRRNGETPGESDLRPAVVDRWANVRTICFAARPPQKLSTPIAIGRGTGTTTKAAAPPSIICAARTSPVGARSASRVTPTFCLKWPQQGLISLNPPKHMRLAPHQSCCVVRQSRNVPPGGTPFKNDRARGSHAVLRECLRDMRRDVA
jgi:hypothetical protein